MVRRTGVVRPPRLASVLLFVVAARSQRAFLLGDLAEEFRDVATDRGTGAASRWYWSQAVHSAGPLLADRLTSEHMMKSLGAGLTGAIAAIISATLLGVGLGLLLDPARATFPTIALVVTLCALVSSTCAGLASHWVSGGPYRWALVFIGLIVVMPDFVHAVRSHGAHGPMILLPPSLAVMAAWAGLSFGGKLYRVIRFQS